MVYQCPICNYRFESEDALEQHCPCPSEHTEWAPEPDDLDSEFLDYSLEGSHVPLQVKE